MLVNGKSHTKPLALLDYHSFWAQYMANKIIGPSDELGPQKNSDKSFWGNLGQGTGSGACGTKIEN